MTDSKLKIKTGTGSFATLITQSDVYVDKTLFIKEIIDNDDEAILITRPRRWGKTLGLDMLRTFFNIEPNATIAEFNRALFAGGSVNITLPLTGTKAVVLPPSKLAQVDSGAYLRPQGQYPVVYITFKDVSGTTYQEIKNKLRDAIKGVYRHHAFLQNSTTLELDEIDRLQRHMKGKFKDASQPDSLDEFSTSLQFLTELLHKHYGQKVYVLVDEYDKPVNSLLVSGATFGDRDLQTLVEVLITSVLAPCGKDNIYLEKIILTGIFDAVKKTGMSGFNNVKVFGINDIRFSQSFGFSEQEVDELVDKLGFDEDTSAVVRSRIKEWYNGYSVPVRGGSRMQAYTPWAVMSYLEDASSDQTFEPKSYWSDSGVADILERLLTAENCANSLVSRKLAIAAGDIPVELDFGRSISLFKYNLGYAAQEEIIFAYLLLNAGYLTVSKEGDRYMFRIPNLEVKAEFTDVVRLVVKEVTNNRRGACGRILDSLSRPKHVKAVRAIKANDTEALEHLFKPKGSLRCEDSSLNFNYFHIAAIYGNQTVLGILKENCDPILLGASDTYGLKPVDYSYMLGLGADAFDGTSPLSSPAMTARISCTNYGKALVAGTTGATGMGLTFLTDLPIWAKVTLVMGAGVVAAGSVFIEVIENAVSHYFDCENYARYSAIDSSDLKRFDNASQLIKYKLTHGPEVYIASDDKCHGEDVLLATVSSPIFKDGAHPDEQLVTTLCSMKPVATVETAKGIAPSSNTLTDEQPATSIIQSAPPANEKAEDAVTERPAVVDENPVSLAGGNAQQSADDDGDL